MRGKLIGILLITIGVGMVVRSWIRDSQRPPKKWDPPRFDGYFWGSQVALLGLILLLAPG